jgi:hypothetical protein
MQYKYAREQQDYSDFSSGRVFYSMPGHPAFPVRLASEIFQRCMVHRAAIYNAAGRCTLYDPCCGAAYHLSVLGFLHGEQIREIIASDIDETAVTAAGRNLGLLHRDGLDKRIRELSAMLEQYGKDSHREALQSASVLKENLLSRRENWPVATKIFQANATDRKAISSHIQPQSVDILFTDVPHGRHSQWHDTDSNPVFDPLKGMLNALKDIVSASSILAIASDKQQKVSHESYQRIEHFQVGKRRVVILKPA